MIKERIASFFRRKEFLDSISIGPLQEKDISGYAALDIKVMGWDLNIESLSEREKYFLHALAQPEAGTFLTAKDGTGKIIGGLEAKIEIFCGKKAAKVIYVFVDPDARGQGVATKLYRTYEKDLLNSGDVFYILAGIHSDNGVSLGLHKKIGINQFCDGDEHFAFYYKALR